MQKYIIEFVTIPNKNLKAKGFNILPAQQQQSRRSLATRLTSVRFARATFARV